MNNCFICLCTQVASAGRSRFDSWLTIITVISMNWRLAWMDLIEDLPLPQKLMLVTKRSQQSPWAEIARGQPRCVIFSAEVDVTNKSQQPSHSLSAHCTIVALHPKVTKHQTENQLHYFNYCHQIPYAHRWPQALALPVHQAAHYGNLLFI